MNNLLTVYVPLFGFMLIPVWIPIIAGVTGAVVDRVRPPVPSAAQAAVETAKARSAVVLLSPAA